FANVVWDELAQNLFTRGRSTPVPLTSQSRQFLVVQNLLADPGSPWWTNTEIGVSGQRDMLEASARSATEILTTAQGSNPLQWRWGTLHAITLTHETFGTSGIAPIEALFNRGPFPVGGGSSVVNATGWPLGEGFATTTVPSMRMVVDLSHFDASGWNHLTGASGHAFHENYTDQTATWQAAGLIPWAFTRDAVTAATEHTLTLEPAN
ncbi:MAG TPA: penicillin acylase family protein, partial [Microbacterium sp.]|nr:penicillin acylase family protein [Microbacterium sp.]